MALKLGILLIYSVFFPTFFGRRGDLAVVLCLPTVMAYSYLFFVAWSCEGMARHHCQLLKFLLSSSSKPFLAPTAWAEDGLPLASLWFSPMFSRLPCWLRTSGRTVIWDRENLWQGQSISQISPYMKIRMLNRNCPRTIAKSGPYPVTLIQLLSVFLGKIPTRGLICTLTSLTANGALGIAVKRWDWAPYLCSRRDPRKSENWRYVLGG